MSGPILPRVRYWPKMILLLPLELLKNLYRTIRQEREKQKPTENLCPYGRGRCSYADGSDCLAPEHVLLACEKSVNDAANWNQ